jgi:hypothetical protein
MNDLGKALENQAKIIRKLNLPKKQITKKVVEYIEKSVKETNELPKNFDILVETLKIPASSFAVEEMKHAISQEIGWHVITEKRILALWTFCIKYFGMETYDKAQVLENVIKGFVFDKAEEEILDQVIQSLDLKTGEDISDSTKVTIRDVLIEMLPIWIVDFERILRVIAKLGITDEVLFDKDVKPAAAEGALSKIDCGGLSSAKKIIEKFDLSKKDFVKKMVLERVTDNIAEWRLDDLEYIVEHTGISTEDVAGCIRERLDNVVRRDLTDVTSLTTKYGIPWSEVITTVEKSVLEDLETPWPCGDVYLLDKYQLPETFLKDEKVVEAAKSCLLRAEVVEVDTKKVGFLKSKFNL